jgi:DNA-binding NtrC family response regulator
MMRQNQFRSDLFFRLSVHQIEVPPLRQHKEDIPLLLQHFLDEAAARSASRLPNRRTS